MAPLGTAGHSPATYGKALHMRGPRTRRRGWGRPERIHGSTGAGGQRAPRRLGRQQNTAVRPPWLSGGRARCAPGVSWRWTVCQTSPTRMVRCVFPCSSLMNTRRVQRCRLWLLTTCYELASLLSSELSAGLHTDSPTCVRTYCVLLFFCLVFMTYSTRLAMYFLWCACCLLADCLLPTYSAAVYTHEHWPIIVMLIIFCVKGNGCSPPRVASCIDLPA